MARWLSNGLRAALAGSAALVLVLSLLWFALAVRDWLANASSTLTSFPYEPLLALIASLSTLIAARRSPVSIEAPESKFSEFRTASELRSSIVQTLEANRGEDVGPMRRIVEAFLEQTPNDEAAIAAFCCQMCSELELQDWKVKRLLFQGLRKFCAAFLTWKERSQQQAQAVSEVETQVQNCRAAL